MPNRTRSSKSAAPDAIDLLTADHKEVKTLFKQYDKLVAGAGTQGEKQALAERICQMLTVHATIEEELFYPTAREALGKDADLIDEADVEHASAKELIAQIQASSPGDDHFDAKVRVLGEYIDHHVKEEEGQIFPKARKGKLDTATLGAALSARKEELTAALTEETAH